MHYPVRNSTDWREYAHVAVWSKPALLARDIRLRLRARRSAPLMPDLCREAREPLGESDLVCICVARNTAETLPSFLRHYRDIGVSRFAFVDDRSDDGTRDMLLAEPDIDVYQAKESFRESDGGLRWRDALVRRYGRHRWYVSVDSDEYLVFPDCERRGLPAFIRDLEGRDLRRALAVMLDIYPDEDGNGDPGETTFPTAASPFFDGSSYRVSNEKLCTSIRGGPRDRVFGASMRLTKFPVIFADGATSFAGAGHHSPLPLGRNFSAVQSVLLHHKFPGGWRSEFGRIAQSGSHFAGSTFYRQIVEHRSFDEIASFRTEASLRYAGSEDLVRRGFMQDLRLP